MTKELLSIHDNLATCPEIGRALWRLNEGRKRLIEVLAELDDSMLDWQPDETANSIGSLLYHIAAIEADWLFVEVLERPFSPEITSLLPWEVRDGNGRLSHIPNQSLVAHLDRLATVRYTLLDAFRNMTEEDYRTVRSLDPYDVTPEWVLFHLTQHEAEHRGQIQEMVRLFKLVGREKDVF